MLRGDAHSPRQTPSSEANIGGRCWADAHISDFQCLKPVVMPKYFSACLLERIYGMAREAERRGTCQTHGNDKHFKLYLQVWRMLLGSHTARVHTHPPDAQANRLCHEFDSALVSELRRAMEEADSEWGLLQGQTVTVRMMRGRPCTPRSRPHCARERARV